MTPADTVKDCLFKEMGDFLLTLSVTMQTEPGGDRVYLRSTNDADRIKELARSFDSWCWDSPEGRQLCKELDSDD